MALIRVVFVGRGAVAAASARWRLPLPAGTRCLPTALRKLHSAPQIPAREDEAPSRTCFNEWEFLLDVPLADLCATIPHLKWMVHLKSTSACQCAGSKINVVRTALGSSPERVCSTVGCGSPAVHGAHVVPVSDMSQPSTCNHLTATCAACNNPYR